MLDPPYGTIDSIIEIATGLSDRAAVVCLYRDWITANSNSPHLAVAWFNLGVEASNLQDSEAAETAYRAALNLQPNFYQAALNLGLLQEKVGAPKRALETWRQALQPQEARIALLNQSARLLEQSEQLQAAEIDVAASLKTSSDQPDALQHWIHLRQRMCCWPVLPDAEFGLGKADLLRFAGPLGALALTDDTSIQAYVAAAWIARKTSKPPERISPICGYAHDKLRVGYVSSDFGRHAMGYLIADLFKHHDRNRFVVSGYCIGREDGSALRSRIVGSFDNFVLLCDLSDEDAARRIASDEIDILIDLNGLTRGARPQILRWRPAPIQATYLGYIGSVPLPELDYLLCDEYVIPEELAPQYSPAPLYIGPVYQANVSQHEACISTSRAETGLPEKVFVFCNFSNHYKITEEMFSAWMAILRRVPNSILWLAEDNQWSRLNMLTRAAQLLVGSERIVFTGRASPDVYMARFTLAELYLDTFPYNSGTVASDALRMSLPLLNLRGDAFASRMAARLLKALGADLGIAESVAGYIETAVLLATRPEVLGHYRALFNEEAWQATIGNIASFTKSLEDKLYKMYADLTQGILS